VPRRRTPLILLLLTGALLGLVGLGLASPRARTLPDVLTDVESGAEDIVDFALSQDRSDAISVAAELKASANGPAARALTASGVPPREVRELEVRANRLARVARKGQFVQIALAANAISQLMPDLYAHFRNRVPPLILALDYFDREAQLRSLAHEPAKVSAAVEGLRTTWPRVRPKVRAAGGGKEVAAFDRHVHAMTGLRSGAANRVQAEAIRGLELVDELERVFSG
jgi:hypothetical protein